VLVKILPAGAHSAVEIIEAGNQNAIHALLQRPHTVPYNILYRIQVPAVKGHTDS